MNCFKELEKDQIKLFAEARHKRVYDRVHGSLGSLRFLSSIIEMYVPVMADTMVSLSGGVAISTPGSTEKDEKQSVDTDSENGRPPSGPALLGDEEADNPRTS